MDSPIQSGARLPESVALAFVIKPRLRVYVLSNWPNSKQLVNPVVGSEAAVGLSLGTLKTEGTGVRGPPFMTLDVAHQAALAAQACLGAKSGGMFRWFGAGEVKAAVLSNLL